MKLYTLESRKFLKACFHWTLLCCLLLTSAFILGCGSEDDDDHDDHDHAEAFDADTMLNDFTNGIVVPTYTDLDNKAGELLSAVKALQGDTSQGNLEKAQQAWVEARIPWEQSEAFSVRSCRHARS